VLSVVHQIMVILANMKEDTLSIGTFTLAMF